MEAQRQQIEQGITASENARTEAEKKRERTQAAADEAENRRQQIEQGITASEHARAEAEKKREQAEHERRQADEAVAAGRRSLTGGPGRRGAELLGKLRKAEEDRDAAQKETARVRQEADDAVRVAEGERDAGVQRASILASDKKARYQMDRIATRERRARNVRSAVELDVAKRSSFHSGVRVGRRALRQLVGSMAVVLGERRMLSPQLEGALPSEELRMQLQEEARKWLLELLRSGRLRRTQLREERRSAQRSQHAARIAAANRRRDRDD